MPRQYEKTHPWLKFNIPTDRITPDLWMSLGEAASKCDHIAGVPLPPGIAEDLHKLYLIKGIRATTAIEGNTLSEEEVRQQIEGKLDLPESKEYLGQEIQNVLDACNMMLAEVQNEASGALAVEQIKEYNRIVLRGLELDPDVIPGVVAYHNVVVGRYKAPPREDCDYLLDRMCEWLNDPSFRPTDSKAISIGILRAILAHLYLVLIHPFADGNGRTSRLVEVQILLAAGVPSPACHLLSNHYNETRTEYYRQLDRISKSGGEMIPFIYYAVKGMVDGLKAQLHVIRATQWNIMWQHFIYEQFQGRESKADKRRRELILALSKHTEPIQLHKMMQQDPNVAILYVGLAFRTYRRDLEELVGMDLVLHTWEGYSANKKLILNFLPIRKQIP
jgi:Fic family protein